MYDIQSTVMMMMAAKNDLEMSIFITNFSFIGPQCPKGVSPSGRGLKNRPDLKNEILRRHNEYRADVRAGETGLPATNCIPDLR